MIEKMKFLSITGPKGDIDRVVNQYFSRYPIHLENALAELSQVKDLYPYMEANPYREWLSQAEEYMELLPESGNL
ncbi:MAG: ATPase, partial [Clostridiales bacterium]|nr:ATPase [Clostridiales bacterium]